MRPMSTKVEFKQLYNINDEYREASFVVSLKPFMTRASQKKVNAIMLGRINVQEAKDSNFEVSIADLNASEDLAIVEMIASATIDGEKVENLGELVDNLSAENYELIKEEVQKITSVKKTSSNETGE